VINRDQYEPEEHLHGVEKCIRARLKITRSQTLTELLKGKKEHMRDCLQK